MSEDKTQVVFKLNIPGMDPSLFTVSCASLSLDDGAEIDLLLGQMMPPLIPPLGSGQLYEAPTSGAGQTVVKPDASPPFETETFFSVMADKESLQLRIFVETSHISKKTHFSWVADPVVFSTYTEGAKVSPSLVLSPLEARNLMDELWNCRVRPSIEAPPLYALQTWELIEKVEKLEAQVTALKKELEESHFMVQSANALVESKEKHINDLRDILMSKK